MAEEKKERLFSLDALRGLDMLFLCVVGSLMHTASAVWGFSDVTAHPFMRQFNHYWGGFTAYDIIMPLFIFMSGAAVPFALGRRLDAEGRPTAAFWRHIAWRFVLLWFLGMVAQGNIRSLDPLKISPFNNTLQTIAVGYVIAALVLLVRRRWLRLAIPAALALIYGVALACWGDYSKEGNLAYVLETKILTWMLPAGSTQLAFSSRYGYTWFTTIPMFGFMAVCGSLSTELIRSALTPWRKAGALAAAGAGLLVVGLVAEWAGIPCIKHIFTFSCTLQAMGWCVLLLAALYVINDIWKFRRGWWIVTLFGQTALACYLMGSMFRGDLKHVAVSCLWGLERFFGEKPMPFVYEIGACVLLAVALWIWRDARNGRRRG